MTREKILEELLKGVEILLSKQEKSRLVLDILSTYVSEDEVLEGEWFGDGYSLLEEIRILLEV